MRYKMANDIDQDLNHTPGRAISKLLGVHDDSVTQILKDIDNFHKMKSIDWKKAVQKIIIASSIMSRNSFLALDKSIIASDDSKMNKSEITM